MRAPPAPAVVSLLRQCIGMGAHPRTLTLLSGVSVDDLRRWVLPPGARVPTGRPPYHLLVEARMPATPRNVVVCGFATDFLRLLDRGIDPTTALLYAYAPRHDTGYHELTFDSAFYLVSAIVGRWACARPSVVASSCPSCGYAKLRLASSDKTSACVLCLAQRLTLPISAEPRSMRVSVPSIGQWPGARDHELASGAFVKSWHALRAPDDVIALLMMEIEGTPAYDASFVRRHLARRPTREFPLTSFEKSIGTIGHAQSSLGCARYERMLGLGISPLDSLRLSYALLDGTFRFLRPMPFRKFFWVICHHSGAYGAPKALDLVYCSACGMRRVVSTLDERPLGCPFCRLLWSPNRYLKSRPVHTRHSPRFPCDADGMVRYVG